MSTNSHYNEKEILQLVSMGDEIAFTRLFRQWSHVLAGFIFQLTESRELTEEIVQVVFLNIWGVRETLLGIDNFKYFLLVVARNKAYDALKKQLREEQHRRVWEKDNEQAIDQLPLRRMAMYAL